MKENVTILFRPVGPKELELIASSGFKTFPASGAGYVMRFAVREEFAARFPIQIMGASVHQELWIPAEQLEEMNRNIVGLIEVIAEYKADGNSLTH